MREDACCIQTILHMVKIAGSLVGQFVQQICRIARLGLHSVTPFFMHAGYFLDGTV